MTFFIALATEALAPLPHSAFTTRSLDRSHTAAKLDSERPLNGHQQGR